MYTVQRTAGLPPRPMPARAPSFGRSRAPTMVASNLQSAASAELMEAVATAPSAPSSRRASEHLSAENSLAEMSQQQAIEVTSTQSGPAWWEVDCPVNMVNVTTLSELDQTVREGSADNRLVVVNFFAPECYACKSLQPKLRQIARDNPDTLFVKVNGFLDELRAYCEAMNITRIPYFHFYRNNKRVSEFTANMRPEKLALLRAEIAAHKGGSVASADNVQYQTLEA